MTGDVLYMCGIEKGKIMTFEKSIKRFQRLPSAKFN